MGHAPGHPTIASSLWPSPLTKIPHCSAHMWKFADDTTRSEVVLSDGVSELQETVQEITDWTNLNRFQLNPKKKQSNLVPRHFPSNENKFYHG